MRQFLILTSLILLLTTGCEKGSDMFSSKVVSDEDQPPSLQDLNYFVGNWVDDEEDIDVKINFSWDPSKHFLIQKFTMDSDETEPLEGYQIIGWDPAHESIRSWIFDSEGGFGEATWERQENKWVSNVQFTISDGEEATATYIYEIVDQNTYTFSVENRDVGGVVKPNVGPFKIIRKK